MVTDSLADGAGEMETCASVLGGLWLSIETPTNSTEPLSVSGSLFSELVGGVVDELAVDAGGLLVADGADCGVLPADSLPQLTSR